MQCLFLSSQTIFSFIGLVFGLCALSVVFSLRILCQKAAPVRFGVSFLLRLCNEKFVIWPSTSLFQLTKVFLKSFDKTDQ